MAASLPFWVRYMPHSLRGWLLRYQWFLKRMVNIPSVACRLKREPELKVELQRLIIPKHKFTDRGDGQCGTCQGPLLVGRDHPHEAGLLKEAKTK